jgi:hypothetical protein
MGVPPTHAKLLITEIDVVDLIVNERYVYETVGAAGTRHAKLA